MQTQLGRAKQEITRLQEEVGTAHRRHQHAKENLDEAKSQAREEHQRAVDFKRKLSKSSSPAKREATLRAELEAVSKQLSLTSQKFEMIEIEREDLRAYLQDHDRFNTFVEEEVPSFRNRPLTAEEVELGELISKAKSATPRILVVGGGEPQFRHLDKFKEYAEVLGFSGSWRMAEYESWHKEMTQLSKDMESNFDALVILHWNRTTFTRKAREICNIKGQKPCITCHYEGFVSLRQTLGTCIRQVLRRN